MDIQEELFKQDIASFKIPYIIVDSLLYFNGKDIATILGYSDTKQAIRVNVDDDDKQKLEELNKQVGGVSNKPLDYNDRNTIYINESGLYSLILRSEKPEAKIFKTWIASELLPSIRSLGSYIIPKTINKQIILKNEKDLHYKVINFIKDNYPEVMLIPGLGEYQTTSSLRCDAYNKGYCSGQPDILILNSHKTYNGFALELKNPNGSGKVPEKNNTVILTTG